MNTSGEERSNLSFLNISGYRDPNPAWRRVMHYAFFFGLGFLSHWLLTQ